MRGGKGAKVALPPPALGAKFKRLKRGNGGKENGYQSHTDMGVSINGVPLNHPFRMGFSPVNHPFWGIPIYQSHTDIEPSQMLFLLHMFLYFFLMFLGPLSEFHACQELRKVGRWVFNAASARCRWFRRGCVALGKANLCSLRRRLGCLSWVALPTGEVHRDFSFFASKKRLGENIGYLLISMDTSGYLWIPMDTFGYLWIPPVSFSILIFLKGKCYYTPMVLAARSTMIPRWTRRKRRSRLGPRPWPWFLSGTRGTIQPVFF